MLAPMEGITNELFRECVIDLGGVDVVATEFVRITAENQRVRPFFRHRIPLQIQVMGNDAKVISGCVEFLKSKQMLSDEDWLDVNVGCPSKRVNSRGAGAALLLEPAKIVEIVELLRRVHPGLLSIKTRLGFQSDEKFPEILAALKNCPLDLITIHARARCQGYDSPINLARLKQAVDTLPYPVIGNGDIWNEEDALKMLKDTGVAGLMCGRGAVSNPFIFKDIRCRMEGRIIDKSFRRAELFNFALKILGYYQQAELQNQGRFLGRTKEFLIWFSKNPLIGADLWQSIKVARSLSEIKLALQEHSQIELVSTQSQIDPGESPRIL